MGEAIVSSLIDTVIGKLTSAAWDEVVRLIGVNDEVTMLNEKLSVIQKFLRDAEERQLKEESVKQWLLVLKDIAYEADDLLDSFEAEVLRYKSEGDTEEDNYKMQSFPQWGWFSSCPSCMKQVSSRHKIAVQLESLSSKLDKTLKLGTDLQLKGLPETREVEVEVPAWRETSSFLDHNVIGMDRDRDNIISSLLELDDDDDDDNAHVFSVLAIVGIGGIGKTTLARYIFNDKRMMQHFRPMMWVFVSHDFNVKRLTKQIIRAVDGDKPFLEDASLERLQKDLAERIDGKRFFLVLDDAWNNDWHQWEQLRAPLNNAARGSKILITTRRFDVSHAVGVKKRFPLVGLSKDDYWSFFKRCAFSNADPRKFPKLEEIGRAIAEKLEGSPLAAKTLGRILSSRLEESHWEKINDSELWELNQGQSEILPALRLSYQYLPFNLRECFGYCSMFPKDWQFDRDELVQMWMGQGFIQPQHGERTEDAGIRYFNDLFDLYFFQPSEHGYTMHYLIHDLAQYIYKDECSRVDMKFHRIPNKARHLSLSIPNPDRYHLDHMRKLTNLRSLLFPRGFELGFDCIPRNLFIELRSIRVLDLRSCKIIEVPESICNLIHLRYLDLSSNHFTKLPEMFTNLYHLQTLKLQECQRLSDLPKGMSELINLRHLKVHSELVTKIDRIGKLTSLQELEVFKVKNKNGFRIGELKDMSDLGGRLSIQNLADVGSGDEAREANLNKKPRLSAIELKWNDDDNWKAFSSDRKDAEILEALQPHENIKELYISGFAGIKNPTWMQPSTYRNLKIIGLSNCRKWEVLPPLGQFQSLKYLLIKSMHGIKQAGLEFYGCDTARGFPLEELEFDDMPEWKEWCSRVEDGQCFPHLCRLAVLNCPKLSNMPPLPSTLRKIDIFNVGVIKLPDYWDGSSPSPLLYSLNIRRCSRIRSLNEGLLRFHLRDLGKLIIGDCDALLCLPEQLQALSSLRYLTMEKCPKLLESWKRSHLPHSLEKLEISSCPQVVNGGLFLQLQQLTSLSSCLISKEYPNLRECTEDVLSYIVTVKQLTMRFADYEEYDSMLPGLVLFQYSRELLGSKLDLDIGWHPSLHSHHESSSLIWSLTRNLNTISIWEISGCCPYISSIINAVLPHLTALKSMKISKCMELTSLEGPHTLEKLEIDGCKHLISLDLASLQHLTVSDCPKLTKITSSLSEASESPLQTIEIDKFSPELLTILLSQGLNSLRQLSIARCNDLLSLPEELHSLSSLINLRLESCPQLQLLPEKGLPNQLANFEITLCPYLKQQLQLGNESDWSKIEHISTMVVDGEDFQKQKQLIKQRREMQEALLRSIQNEGKSSEQLKQALIQEDLRPSRLTRGASRRAPRSPNNN